jgi:hypothetical protein
MCPRLNEDFYRSVHELLAIIVPFKLLLEEQLLIRGFAASRLI